MTVDELLVDLRERIDKGVDELEELALAHEGGREEVRLLGKASGLLVVRDWLRSYDTPAPSMRPSPPRNPLDLPVPEGDPPDEYRTPENMEEQT